MRKRTVIVLAAALLWSASATAAELPAWLAGGWRQDTANGWVEEQWSRPKAGEMTGLGRTMEDGEPASWEQMRIVRAKDGSLAFYAAPDGEDVTIFPLLSQTDREIVFLNAAHDYPQRIRYWREGETLHAEIALKDGGKAQGWVYRPVKGK